jgi:hypothetical protein
LQIEGKRIRRTQLVGKGRYVVSIETEMVVPEENPGEAGYEPETSELLRQASQHADQISSRGKSPGSI